jgi:hypothetical protein
MAHLRAFKLSISAADAQLEGQPPLKTNPQRLKNATQSGSGMLRLVGMRAPAGGDAQEVLS